MEQQSKGLTLADGMLSELSGPRTPKLLERLDAATPWETLAAAVRPLYRNDTATGGRPNLAIVTMLRPQAHAVPGPEKDGNGLGPLGNKLQPLAKPDRHARLIHQPPARQATEMTTPVNPAAGPPTARSQNRPQRWVVRRS